MPVKDGVRPRPKYYNAAFLVKPDGMVGAIYRKMHLVPFGEYVPLKRLLFFVDAITGFPDFTPGEEGVLLPVGDHLASTAICYEVIYGDAIRDAVRRGSELLTTITNDAWYGRSSAAYQHWEQASMRAIENGRYLARAANTGISGFVDPYGRVLDRSELFEQRTLIHDVRFLNGRTVYSYVGDLVAWLSLAFVVAALLASRTRLPAADALQYSPHTYGPSTGRTASQARRSGAPRQRPAELSLTPQSRRTNFRSSKRASRIRTSGRIRRRRRSSSSAGAGSRRIATSATG